MNKSRIISILFLFICIIIINVNKSYSWMKNETWITKEMAIDFESDPMQVKDLIEFNIYQRDNDGNYVLNNSEINVSNLNKKDVISFLLVIDNHNYNNEYIDLYLNDIELDDYIVFNNKTIFDYLNFGYIKFNNNDYYKIEYDNINLNDGIINYNVYENTIYCDILLASDIYLEYTDSKNPIYLYCYIEVSDNLPNNYNNISLHIDNFTIKRS